MTGGILCKCIISSELRDCVAFAMPRFKGFSMDRRGKYRENMRGNREGLGKGFDFTGEG